MDENKNMRVEFQTAQEAIDWIVDGWRSSV